MIKTDGYENISFFYGLVFVYLLSNKKRYYKTCGTTALYQSLFKISSINSYIMGVANPTPLQHCK